jgi:hypothetical protein
MNLVKTSYDKSDVEVLLKDLTGQMKELPTAEREKLIQSGVHYSMMLPQEKEPSAEYEHLYDNAMKTHKKVIALYVARVAEKMMENTKNDNYQTPVIISLARAGVPIGILIKRYILDRYGMDCPHYAISIIRDKGIDNNAMKYIYDVEVVDHRNEVKNFCFVDGWTGKGMIQMQLTEAVHELQKLDDIWKDLSDDLYVLADPANVTELCGTHDDFLIPSSCLNSTVSGLTSRTILNDYINVEQGDFHGAVYFERFELIDRSNEFINEIDMELEKLDKVDIWGNVTTAIPEDKQWSGLAIVKEICKEFDIPDFKKVKPGIGETTRVLLRRVPYKVLINKNTDRNDPDIQHILLLCQEKNVTVSYEYDLNNYKVIGIIKELSADA